MRIALTFDDGPNTVTTPRVLDVLEEYGIPATFFLISDNINPESASSVRRALSLGCEIENHSVTHSPMAEMPREQIQAEIAECSRRVTEITGKPPRFFRPPFISVSPQLFAAVDLTLICGSHCEDWNPDISSRERAERTLANARDGEIILLHDRCNNEATVEALKLIIPALRDRGYTFHTVSGLFAACGVSPVPRRLYSNVFQTADRPDPERT